MKTSIALIALTVATLSGAASAATAQASLFDKTAMTTASTIWSTGELGYIQNPNGAVKKMIDAPKATGTADSSVDVAGKTSASTVWTFGEVGYVQNRNYVASTSGTVLTKSMARSQAIAAQASVKTVTDISITF